MHFGSSGFFLGFFFVLLAAAHVSVPLIWHLSTYTFSRIPPRCQTHLAALHAGQICDLILHYPPRSLLSLTQATLLSSLSSHLLSWHSADTCRLAASARWYWPNPEPVQIQPVRRRSWSPLAWYWGQSRVNYFTLPLITKMEPKPKHSMRNKPLTQG